MANYKATVKLHLPTDEPWRNKPEDHKNEISSDSPEEMWRLVIMAITQRLAMDRDPGFFIGLMLNLINPFPEDMRGAIVNGIVSGLGMSLLYDKEIGELIGSLDPKFPSLTMQGPEGPERRTASGLIVPG